MAKLDIIYLLACKQKTDGLDTYRGEAVPFSPKAVGGPIVYRSMPSVLKTVFIIQEKGMDRFTCLDLAIMYSFGMYTFM
jgi:hypothetical protein